MFCMQSARGYGEHCYLRALQADRLPAAGHSSKKQSKQQFAAMVAQPRCPQHHDHPVKALLQMTASDAADPAAMHKQGWMVTRQAGRELPSGPTNCGAHTMVVPPRPSTTPMSCTKYQGSSAHDGQSGLTTMHKYNELHNKP